MERLIAIEAFDENWVTIQKGSERPFWGDRKKPRKVHISKIDAYCDSLIRNGYTIKRSLAGIYAIRENGD